jgi:hypothetical protein
VAFAAGSGSTAMPAVWTTYSAEFVCAEAEAGRAVTVLGTSVCLRGRVRLCSIILLLRGLSRAEVEQRMQGMGGKCGDGRARVGGGMGYQCIGCWCA